jgi:integrase
LNSHVPATLAIYLTLLLSLTAAACLSRFSIERRSRPVGTPLEPSNVLKRFKTRQTDAGLPPQSFHDPRHCAASLLIAQGVPLKVVSDILGHSQHAMTSDLYSHLYRSAHDEAAVKMNQILSGAN